MAIARIQSIHHIPRPPKLRSEPVRPLGPRRYRLGTEPASVPDFFEPPAGFPGPNISKAHVSRTEWAAYHALSKVMGTPRDPRKPPFTGGVDWDYQTPDPIAGGRQIAGGAVIDFVIRRGEPPFAIRIQTNHWHVLASPEVIMFGMTQEIANGLLWEAHRQLKAGELMLRDKAAWSLDWEDGPQFAWRAVHPSQIRRDHFNIAIWYKERQGGRRSDLKAFQLFVADTQGLFPWEEGFDTDSRPIQPELYLPFFGPADDD